MSLNETERSALSAFKSELVSVLHDPELQVTLFGSKARGDDRAESDVDVLVVVSSTDWRVTDHVYALATRILLDTGVLISPKVVARNRYREMVGREAPFAMSVVREGVPV